jgi:hypothetical protein
MTQSTGDIEQLMIDALDGAITLRDNQVLRAYLDRHPDERTSFEQMTAFDHTMRAEAVPAAPATMTRQVMTAVWQAQAHIAQPVFKAPQIAFLIGLPIVLLLVIGLTLVGVYMLISPVFPPTELRAGFALVRAVADVVECIVVAVIVFLRALRSLYSIPLTWAITIGLAIVVAGWMRIMVAIWLPLRPLST